LAATEPVNPKAIVLARLTENELPHVGCFNCGDEEMNTFLRVEAYAEQAMGMNSTVLLYYQGSLAAFCSVCCDAIPLSDAEREEEQITVHYKAPAIKIARLGRDLKFVGIGLGQVLIEYVKDMAHELSTSRLGVRFITTDAYLQRVDYYGRLGFIPNQAAHGRSSPTKSMRADIYG
jgi:GNAT superfamily N-acetyltransferase